MDVSTSYSLQAKGRLPQSRRQLVFAPVSLNSRLPRINSEFLISHYRLPTQSELLNECDNSIHVADNLVARHDIFAAHTHQKSFVGADEVGIAVETSHVTWTGIRCQFYFDSP